MAPTPHHSYSRYPDLSMYSQSWSRRRLKRRVSSTPKPETSTFLDYEELPRWLKDNHFINGSYRNETDSVGDCLTSIFSFHNETVNIWSHIIPAIIVIFRYVSWLSIAAEVKDMGWGEYLVVSNFFLGAFLCFLFSAAYHTFSCHSERMLLMLLKFDYAGIVMMVMGSYFPWIHYMYHCEPTLRKFYYLMGVLVATGIIIISRSTFFDRVENRTLRAMVFITNAAFCFMAVLHYIALYGVPLLYEKGKIDYIISMGFSYFIGGLIYATRVPERFWPGYFNVFGHSHQIFHLFVVLGASYYHSGLMAIVHDRDNIFKCARRPRWG